MSQRILIIEDETAIQSILSEMLTDAGYNIEVAGDGLEGITKFRERLFSLVLLDIMMPKIDGYTVCEMIRQESNVPIIMLTALDEEEAQVKAFGLKVGRLHHETFLRESGTHAGGGGSAPGKRTGGPRSPAILSYGNIRLDRESHTVSVDGETISLTHTEYGLLELFMLHPGRVFTRDNLLNEVWGYDFVGEEKTVNIHIMNLRRKLGADLIETIRGGGIQAW